jgi:uncharacterized protein DUF4384
MAARSATSSLRWRLFFDRLRGPIIIATTTIVISIVIFFSIKYGGSLLSRKASVRNEASQQELADSPIATQVNEAVVDGNYSEALKFLNQGLEKEPDNIALNKIQSQLMEELSIDFKFHYLPGRRSHATNISSGDATLTSDDPYYLTLHISDPCYLYVYQVDSSGALARLFPNSEYVPTPNPVPPGPLRMPDMPDWFYLDDVTGFETIYLVASYWPQRRLEGLAEKIRAEKDSQERRQLTEQFLQRLEIENQATDGLPGLVFGSYQFMHGKASAE